MKKRIAVIGAGAVGGLYGAILARYGHEVYFLARSDFEHISKNGIEIQSKYGNFRLSKLFVFKDIKELPPCDLAILSTKTTSNSEILKPLVEFSPKADSIMVLQNGIGFEEELAGYIDPSKIIGATSFVCSSKVAPGHIHHQDYGTVKLAPYSKGKEAEGSALFWKNLFEESGLEVMLSGDLKKERWKKLFWNIPFNGLSVVLNATTRPLVHNAHSLNLIRDIMEEVRQMALHCGVEVESKFIDKMLRDTSKMADYKPSMYLDFLNRRELEIEYIYDIPIRMAAGNGYRAEKVEALSRQLHFINDNLNEEFNI